MMRIATILIPIMKSRVFNLNLMNGGFYEM